MGIEELSENIREDWMESELDVFVLFKKQLYEQAERARCVWQNLDLKRVL